MKDGFKVFDSDFHIVEPPDLWKRYIDKRYSHRTIRTSEMAFECVFPFIQKDQEVLPAYIYGPGKVPAHVTPAMLESAITDSPQARVIREKTKVRWAEFYKLGWSGQAFLRAMDNEGVDLTVLFPTSGLVALGFSDIEADLADAIARAYNDYVHELCQADPSRLYGAAMISVHDVDNAIREAERAKKELGFKSVFLRPNLVNERNWYDPYYEGLWSALEELGLAVTFHEGLGAQLRHSGDIFRPNLFLHHVACHPMEMMLAMMAFCGGGILERHPRLRVAFLEGNCGWLPWLLNRLDDHYELGFGVTPAMLPKKPSHYFLRQCFLSAECDEEIVGDVVKHVGADNFVTSTDFPHPDSKYPRTIATFLAKEDLTVEQKRKMLWDNCVRLYGMEKELATFRGRGAQNAAPSVEANV